MTTGEGGSDRTGGRERLLLAAREELLEHGATGLSLRGIARRAGVSHAAPKYHFGDRAGLLTAIATSGFVELADALRRAAAVEGQLSLHGLGRSYVAFGLEHPALFHLMFRPDELHPEDPELQAAQSDAIGLLSSAVTTAPAVASADGPPQMALVSWAFAHGLVALARDGALHSITPGKDPQLLIEQLIGAFDTAVS